MSKVPQVITPIPQPNFFIAPTPTPASSFTLQIPQVSASTALSTSISSWPPSLTPLRPQPPFNCPEVYFTAPPCILPTAVTLKNNKVFQSGLPLIRHHDTPTLLTSVKTESDLSNCKVSDSVPQECKLSYPINALIDVPGSLNRGSRTSSLSSSLSSFRFGGSLSQLWATSLSSLSNKVNSMKSTGNLHTEASMPTLGNQYFSFGGSLPELSLTSLTRLLPNSTATTSTDSSSTGLYTLIQSPLCVYPSQSHLATPFINANGSISFGSFLSSGSSLCSNLPKNEANSPSDTESPETLSPNQYTPTVAPGNLSTLAYVASVQKTLESTDQQFPLMTVATQLPSPVQQSLSPIPPSSCLSPEDNNLETNCSPSYNIVKTTGIKLEDDDSAYNEVKRIYTTPSCHTKKESKDKPYKCDYPGCGRSFSFPAHLRSHVQQIHISYRPCKCDFPGCGKRFYTPQHLNVHRRIHTGERPFVCPYADCGKAFTTAGNLKNHIRTHTGEKPYVCKFEGCSKRFAEMSSLKKHELTHTGEKPYKCRVCGKAFSQAGSRNTHERKHSRGDETDSTLARRYRIKRISTDQELQ